MKKFFERLIKYRVVIVIVTFILTIIAGITAAHTTINSDISSYLDDTSMSKETLHIMQEKFNIEGDILVAIGDVELNEVNEIQNTIYKIGELEYIQHNILWLGQYSDFLIDKSGQSILTTPEEEWNLSLEEKKGFNDFISKYFIKSEDSNKGTYIFYISLSAPNSSDEASETIDNVNFILKNSPYKDYYVGGSAAQSKAMLDSALGDIPIFMIVAVSIIMLILLLTSSSYLEPIIFLLTIGIAIILNLGSNVFLESVSSVTFSASSILQLALAMDYSIFLMHAYYQEKKNEKDNKKAMINALTKTIVTVSASALTTIGGFVALFAMRFGLGFDLGIVLAKGVLISLLTVLLFQPCLILALDKFIVKTQHKCFNFKFKKITNSVHKWYKPLVVVSLLLIIPSVILQSKINYYYLDSITFDESATGAQKVVQDSGSQLMVIVNDADNKEKHLEFYEDLKQLKTENKISDITGLYPLEQEIKALYGKGHPFYPFVNNLELKDVPLIRDKFINDDQTYYIIQVTGLAESQDCINTVNQIKNIAHSHFGQDLDGFDEKNVYLTGNTQVVIDLEQTTSTDFLIISVLSAIIIFLILLFTLKSFGLSLILIFTIELGIFINLSITTISQLINGGGINFVSYLIISAIQLGATVDYAILFTKNFQQSTEKTTLLKIKDAMEHSIMSILISALILVSACLSVYFISSDKIISEITMLIARGSAISFLLVTFILPGFIILYKKERKHRKFKKKKDDDVYLNSDDLDLVDGLTDIINESLH